MQIGRALGVAVLAGVQKVETAPAHWVARDRQTARRRNGSRGPTIARALGVVLAITGGLLAITGGVLLALVATDGRLSSGSRLLPTPTSALVSPITSIQNAIGITQGMGTPTLRISSAPAPGNGGVGLTEAGAMRDVMSFTKRLCGSPVSARGPKASCAIVSGVM